MKSVFCFFEEYDYGFANRINKEVKKHIDDVRRLALKYGIEIDLLMRINSGNNEENYDYGERTVFYKKTGQTYPMDNEQYEFMEYLQFGRKLLSPLIRISHFDEIIKRGMDKSSIELLALIDLLSNACEYDEKIKISATIKG